jgi:hypothetical protein
LEYHLSLATTLNLKEDVYRRAFYPMHSISCSTQWDKGVWLIPSPSTDIAKIQANVCG